MKSSEVQKHLTGSADGLYQRIDELAIELVGAITEEVALHHSGPQIRFDAGTPGCQANMQPTLDLMAFEGEFEPAGAADADVEPTRGGLRPPSAVDAFQAGFRRVWQAMVEQSAARAVLYGEASRVLTAKMLTAEQTCTAEMASRDRGGHSGRVLSGESERSSVVDALLHGRLVDQWSLWEVADYLRLPTSGPFVVIAAERPTAGMAALTNIESKLRSLDVFSAWCLLPESQVGIVHVRTDNALENVLALLSRITTTRIGVSARFDDLRETAQAFRCARVTLRGRHDTDPLVSVFDASILSTAAVSAPEVMTKVVAPVLNRFTELADTEREILFETFKVWLEHDGSLRDAGELLFCHPNTVRYRLHRIEQYTGRSLSRPRDIAELCLAFEVHRRLM